MPGEPEVILMKRTSLHKKILVITTASVLSVSMAASCMFVYAADDTAIAEETTEAEDAEATTEEASEEETEAEGTSSEETADEESSENPVSRLKDEMVYVFTDNDGTANRTIVSDWYTDDDGNDNYIMEDSDNDLPIDIKVSYTLDGKEVTADELAGASGHVTIRFDYTNNESRTVVLEDGDTDSLPMVMAEENIAETKAQINGSAAEAETEYTDGDTAEEATIYLPYAVVTGMLFDNEKFSNVEVTNGKAVNDGDRTIVVGCAFPGLQETLDIDTEDVEIPSYVEVSADVTNFEMNMTLSFATCDLLKEINLDDFDKLDDLDSSMDDLKDAMEQLMDGSDELYDGLDTLLSSAQELSDGIGSAADGASQLNDGAASLDEGAASLQTGIDSLYEGLTTLDDNSASLNDGAKTVFETLLSTAQSQIEAAGLEIDTLTIENYAETLEALASTMSPETVNEQAREQVRAVVEEQKDYITSQVTEAVRAEVESQVTEAVQAEVESQVTEAVQAEVESQVQRLYVSRYYHRWFQPPLVWTLTHTILL